MSAWKDIYTQKTSLAGLNADDWFLSQTNAGAMQVVKKSAFGTAAAANTGTAGGTIPLCNGTNTWSATQTFSAAKVDAVTGTGTLTLTGGSGGGSNVSQLSFERSGSGEVARIEAQRSGGNNSGALIFSTAIAGTLAEAVRITPAGVFQPGTDNSKTIGAASFRWSTVYAGTGTINTSDEREKTWLGGLTSAHLAAARRIASEIGLFQFNDALAEKGEDGARIHVGARAQHVFAIMVDEGLETAPAEGEAPDIRHAFLCYDAWPETPAIEEQRDDDGNLIAAAQDARPAGERYGIRYDELAMFLLAALAGAAS